MKTNPKQYQDSIEGTVESHTKDIKKGREADFEKVIEAYKTAKNTADVMDAKKELDSKYKGMYTQGEKRLLQSLDFNLKLHTGSKKAQEKIKNIDLAWEDDSDKGWDEVETTLEQKTEEPILLNQRKTIPLTEKKIPTLGEEYLVEKGGRVIPSKTPIRVNAVFLAENPIAQIERIVYQPDNYERDFTPLSEPMAIQGITWDQATSLMAPKETEAQRTARIEAEHKARREIRPLGDCIATRAKYRVTEGIPEPVDEADLDPRNFRAGFKVWLKDLFRF